MPCGTAADQAGSFTVGHIMKKPGNDRLRFVKSFLCGDPSPEIGHTERVSDSVSFRILMQILSPLTPPISSCFRQKIQYLHLGNRIWYTESVYVGPILEDFAGFETHSNFRYRQFQNRMPVRQLRGARRHSRSRCRNCGILGVFRNGISQRSRFGRSYFFGDTGR